MFTLLEYILLAVLIAVDLIISRWIGHQAYGWMPPQATSEAERVDELFSFLVSAGAFIYIGVISVIIVSLIFFRAKEDDYSEGHYARGNWKLEVLWTVIPIGLVIWIAIQSYNIYNQLNILGISQLVQLFNPIEEAAYAEIPEEPNQNVEEEIQVSVKQWAWTFRYKNGVESGELHLPLNQKVRLLMNSQDVIHGFYVPEFRVKQDIFPNRNIAFIFSPTRPGKYRLQDSQFSGTYFSLIQANVYVEPSQEYHQWLKLAAKETTKKEHIANKPPEIPEKPLFNSGWES